MSEIKQRMKPKEKPEGVDSDSSEEEQPAEWSTWKIFACLAVVLIAVFFFYNSTVSDHNVVVLTDENFNQAVSDNPIMLVEFYAPWCGHCMQLAPKYARVANRFQDAEMPDVTIAKIDAQENKMTARKYEIKSYPTMKFFKNGKILDYTYKGQSSDVIIETLKKISGPVVVQVNSEDEFQNIKKKFPIFMAGYFPDGVNEEYANLAEKMLMLSDEAYFFNVNGDLADELALENGKVTLFKQFDEGRVDFEGPLVEDDLFKFLTKNSLPLLSEFNADTRSQIFQNPNAKHAIIFLSKDSENFNVLTKSFRKAAKEMKESEMVFSYANFNDNFVKHQAKHFNVDESNLPAFRVFHVENGALIKFKPESDEISTESVVDFSKKVLSGEVEQFFKSEEVPENWNEAPVKVLVGKNFKEVAFDENKKVFVLFYAPGNRGTERFMPTWQTLGENYKNTDDVIIAKMDFTANEVDGLEIKVPLVLYQSGKGAKAVDFNVSYLY